jgi:UPF0716 protein FxsA
MTGMLWLLALILWPLLEILAAIEVARATSILVMLLLLVVSWPVGVWALRAEGRLVAAHLARALSDGRRPEREVVDGTLRLAGGALLIVPGFVTDAIGLLLLLPPTRALARAVLLANLRSRLVVRAARFGAGREAYDVESTGVDVEPGRRHVDPPNRGPAAGGDAGQPVSPRPPQLPA